jgi:hypothetical protein
VVLSNGLSFKPSITLSAAIAALTEPHLLMITAVIGKKVPKHLYVVGEMETVPSAAPTTTGGHGWVDGLVACDRSKTVDLAAYVPSKLRNLLYGWMMHTIVGGMLHTIVDGMLHTIVGGTLPTIWNWHVLQFYEWPHSILPEYAGSHCAHVARVSAYLAYGARYSISVATSHATTSMLQTTYAAIPMKSVRAARAATSHMLHCLSIPRAKTLRCGPYCF